MTGSPEIDQRIRDVFAAVLQADSITPETGVDDLEAWDSVGHVDLILALQERFAVQFTDTEIVEASSVTRILAILERKSAL